MNNSIPRQLRKDQTPHEQRLWSFLRNRRLKGYKFRRQFPIDNYVADFCCLEKRLVIELDGSQHNEETNIISDKIRDKHIESQNFRILRIWNNQIDQDIESVLEQILLMLQ